MQDDPGSCEPGSAILRVDSGVLRRCNACAGEPCEQLREPMRRLLSRGEHRDRDAFATACQQRDLVVDQARARAPATLEVQMPAAWEDLLDPPAGEGRRSRAGAAWTSGGVARSASRCARRRGSGRARSCPVHPIQAGPGRSSTCVRDMRARSGLSATSGRPK